MESVSFYTLGCRLNQAETAILEQHFIRCGFRVVEFGQPADLVVVNTCTVTENGDADTRKVVNRINRYFPEARIALIGCQAQIQKERLLEMPGVSFVVGNARKMDLPQFVRDLSDGAVVVPTIQKGSFVLPTFGVDLHHTRANLKIQDGCDFFCAFCEIPYARGRARSREFDDILREARALTEAGHQELVLTGINLGTYRHQGKTLLDVLASLSELPLLRRIRISSIEPSTIPESLIHFMNKQSKLCRYLHIPLQSGSNRVLERMKRNHTVEDVDRLIRVFADAIPEICLGTDVIVGFPGETAEEFEATYAYLRESRFNYFHVFSYSDRQHAQSRKFDSKVSPEEIEKRSRRLRELSFRKRRAFLEQSLGTVQEVLFEQQKKGFWTGLTDTYIRVKVVSREDLENRILPVKLEKVDGQTIIGSLL